MKFSNTNCIINASHLEVKTTFVDYIILILRSLKKREVTRSNNYLNFYNDFHLETPT